MLLLLAIALQDSVTPALRPFVRAAAPVLALTNVRVIDGTGAPAKMGQTIVITRGTITAVGDAASTRPPADATVLDLAGRTVMPGYVMVHEHMYYPSGGGTYPWHGWSFPRLYLAGGATTIRTLLELHWERDASGLAVATVRADASTGRAIPSRP